MMKNHQEEISSDSSSGDSSSSSQSSANGNFPIETVMKNFEEQNCTNNVNTAERSRPMKLFGKLLILLTLISFIFIGLLCNILQLFLCITIRLSDNRQWRRYHKLANGYLIYLVYTQPIFLIYFWPRVDLKVHLADKQLIEDVKKQVLGIIVANHTYELDWMMCFLMADQMGNIGSYKCFAKDELKLLPVIGWSFWMSDLIFVRRDWQQDRLSIGKKLDELLIYDQILLGIFAEGTRMTKEKYSEAIEFARSKQVDPYKYHLFPRSRGFNSTLRHYIRRSIEANDDVVMKSACQIESKTIRLFNLEIVLPSRPNFKHFLEGSYIKADIYCEEVQITEDIKREVMGSKSPEECVKLTSLLRDIYKRKDEIIEQYQEEGGFHTPSKRDPNGSLFPLKKPYGVGIYYIIFMSITYGTFIYLASTVFAESLIFWTLIVIFLTSGMLMLRRIEKESKPNNLRMLKKTLNLSPTSTSSIVCDPKAA